MLLQGAELGTFRVPLHKVHLKCGLVTGAVVVGVRPSLPVQGVSLILGNDLAGGQVACISNVPQNSVPPTVAAEQVPMKVYRVSNSNSQQDLSREQIGHVRCLPGKKMVDNQIFVGRLPKHICSRDLEDIFFPYGKLTRCEVKQGIRLAYGFVEFENRRDAEDAIRLENGREIMGTRIVVEWSRGHKDKNSIRGYDRYDCRIHDRNCYDRGGRDHRYSRRRSYSWSPP